MLGSAWAIATLTVPQTDESHSSAAKPRCRLPHPLIVAFIGVFALLRRAKLAGRDMQRRPRPDRQIAIVPIRAGKIHRVAKEGRFVEWNVDFKPHAARQARLGEQEITAAGAPTNPEVLIACADLRQRCGNCGGCDWLLRRGKPRCLPIGRVDHVAGKEHHVVRRWAGLSWRHHDTCVCRNRRAETQEIEESSDFAGLYGGRTRDRTLDLSRVKGTLSR